MPTKLKHLKIKRVALVDEGANPDAFVRFAKSKDAPGDPDITTEEAQNIFQRFASLVSKALGMKSPISKSAFTFSDTEERRDYDRIMDAEIYPMNWAFMDSIRSILFDTDKGDTDKATLLKQSLSEFTTAFGGCIESWSKAEQAQTNVQKGEDVLEKMRDSLNDLIAKKDGCGAKKPMKKAEDPDDPEDKPDEEDRDDAEDTGKEKPPVVKKGATNMIFDTSKMTPEEKASYEDLAKRFGTEETPTPAAPTATEPTTPATEPTPASEGNDVYKGLHPTVAAELENLRKFREAAEDRQYTEIAKKYALLGKKPEELAPVLKSLKNAGGTAYDDMISLLDSNLAAIEKSGAFSEIGKRGSNSGADDAWGKVEAAAQEIMKVKPEMRYADAIDAACMAHPDLVHEYEKSRC